MSSTVDRDQFASCGRCGATFAVGTKQCPSCGAPVPSKKSEPLDKPQKTRRRVRYALIAAILLVLPHVLPQLRNLVHYRLLFWTSPLVLEAITRVNEHPETEALFGRPVNAGWLSRAYVRSDETGWSEGKIWIPVVGVKAKGTLYARGGRADGPWVFSELRLVREDGRAMDMLAPVKQKSLISSAKDLRVFIVPLGTVQGLGLDELPDFYRARYGLFVKVVDPIPLETRTLNPVRKQRIVEEMVQLMRRKLPDLAKDDSTFLIGVTDEDMYFRDLGWDFAYTAYATGARAGIVSSSRFVPKPLARNETLLRSRVRKMITRTIGFVVLKFPESDDPSSVMYRDLYGSASADLMSDSLEGLGSRAVVDEFQNAHSQRPQEPELLPGADTFDEAKADGRYPCFLLNRRRDTGASTSPFDVTINNDCLQKTVIHTNSDEIEVDLRSGLLLMRTTDLFIPGITPVAATRCYRLWDGHSRAFGHHTALSWDIYPIGSRQPYTYIDVILCDGSRLHYDRISKGTGYADALYEHRQTASPFLRSRFGWNGNGWDLKLKDGSLLLFPESYYGKKAVDGALIGFHDAQRQVVKIERDKRRNLKQITSWNGRFIRFDHDSADRVVKAVDGEKIEVRYFYDAGGRLVRVENPPSVLEYTYRDNSLTFIDENGRRLVDFHYGDWGRIEGISLPDRRSYLFRYEYDPRNEMQVVRTFVTGPKGSVTKFDVGSR